MGVSSRLHQSNYSQQLVATSCPISTKERIRVVGGFSS